MILILIFFFVFFFCLFSLFSYSLADSPGITRSTFGMIMLSIHVSIILSNPRNNGGGMLNSQVFVCFCQISVFLDKGTNLYPTFGPEQLGGMLKVY